jgi:hypothetical protein
MEERLPTTVAAVADYVRRLQADCSFLDKELGSDS